MRASSLVFRTTDIAPATINDLSSQLPLLVIPPVQVRSPLESVRGVRPVHEPKWRADLKMLASGTNALTAVAVIGPTPGIVMSLLISSSAFA